MELIIELMNSHLLFEAMFYAFLLSSLLLILIFDGFKKSLKYFLGFLSLTAVIFIIKKITNVPRPVFNNHVVHALGSSFPSNHAALSFFFATIFLAKYGKKAIPFPILAFLISISRFFVHAHRIAEIIAGSCIGVVAGLFAYYIVEGKIKESDENLRKLTHILLGTFFVCMTTEVSKIKVAEIFSFLFAVSFTFSFILKRAKNGIFSELKFFERKSDFRFPLKGTILFFFSNALIFAIFPKKFAMLGLIALTFGDGFATVIGKKYGNLKHLHNPNKTLEGSLSGFIATFFVSFLFVKPWLAFVNAFVFAFFESLDLEYYFKKKSKIFGEILSNDNFYIPILCSLITYLLYLISLKV